MANPSDEQWTALLYLNPLLVTRRDDQTILKL